MLIGDEVNYDMKFDLPRILYMYIRYILLYML